MLPISSINTSETKLSWITKYANVVVGSIPCILIQDILYSMKLWHIHEMLTYGCLQYFSFVVVNYNVILIRIIKHNVAYFPWLDKYIAAKVKTNNGNINVWNLYHVIVENNMAPCRLYHPYTHYIHNCCVR